MKYVFVCFLTAAGLFGGCTMVVKALSGGGSADVTLTVTTYPDSTLAGIRRLAVMPFQEGAAGGATGDYWTLWNQLIRGNERASVGMMAAEDLSNRLLAVNSITVVDRSIAKSDSALDYVITGSVTRRDVTTGVTDRSYRDTEGKWISKFDGACAGDLCIVYKFVRPVSGEIAFAKEITKKQTFTSTASTYQDAESGLPPRPSALRQLVEQANAELLTMIAPAEVQANFALGTLADDHTFRTAVQHATQGNWDDAVEIWRTYEEKGTPEALYNLMIYKRYVEKDLPGSPAFAAEAYRKTGNEAFLAWERKFAKDRRRWEVYESARGNPGVEKSEFSSQNSE